MKKLISLGFLAALLFVGCVSVGNSEFVKNGDLKNFKIHVTIVAFKK